MSVTFINSVVYLHFTFTLHLHYLFIYIGKTIKMKSVTET